MQNQNQKTLGKKRKLTQIKSTIFFRRTNINITDIFNGLVVKHGTFDLNNNTKKYGYKNDFYRFSRTLNPP